MPINPKPDSTPSDTERAALTAQLNRLRRFEESHKVYREMLAVAEAKVLAR